MISQVSTFISFQAQLKNGQVNVPLSKLCPTKFSKFNSNNDSNNDSINDNDSEEISIEDDYDQSSSNNEEQKDVTKK